MKIRLVVVHFGPWPPWLEYFLQSCAFNPGIDWLLVSDQPLPENCPPNLSFLSMGMENFGKLLSLRLGIPIRLVHPYKICDYRPAMGEIFRDYLEGYEYWGYSDIDLIYGDILKQIAGAMEQKADVIAVREEYLAGHFALLRNSPKTLSLYKNYPFYEKVFRDTGHHYGFDERSGIFGKKLWKNNRCLNIKLLYHFVENSVNRIRFRFAPVKRRENRDLDRIVRNLSCTGQIRLAAKTLVRSDLWYRKKGISGWEITWKDGILTDNQTGEEFLHFHLIRSKHKKSFSIGQWKENRSFRITETGICVQES